MNLTATKARFWADSSRRSAQCATMSASVSVRALLKPLDPTLFVTKNSSFVSYGTYNHFLRNADDMKDSRTTVSAIKVGSRDRSETRHIFSGVDGECGYCGQAKTLLITYRTSFTCVLCPTIKTSRY